MSSGNVFKILKFDHLLSTNNKLKALKQESKQDEFTIVQTYKQTAGKGQGGNSWESEDNKNLTFSLLLKPHYIEIQDQFIISKAITLGIMDAFNHYDSNFSIKWPNDIYYKDKKIGGILIENSICQNVISESIIGIGLNINQTNFISNAPNPISLKTITNKTYDLETVLKSILNSIMIYIEHLKNDRSTKIDQLFLAHLYRKKGFHPYKDKNGKFEAEITGINNYGHLQLNTKEGENRSYAFKEVEFIIS